MAAPTYPWPALLLGLLDRRGACLLGQVLGHGCLEDPSCQAGAREALPSHSLAFHVVQEDPFLDEGPFLVVACPGVHQGPSRAAFLGVLVVCRLWDPWAPPFLGVLDPCLALVVY